MFIGKMIGKSTKHGGHMAIPFNKQIPELEIPYSSDAKPNDSHFWRGLMRIKDEVLAKGSFVIKDGTNTRF